ncbi:MAG: filamentous hemagglutinin N-terminal domain-containing protein, partial [Roseimicrobium sp.]
DPTGSPSQILGSITAQGQVYVINQNGIIFGGASNVNVHTLVASSLPINDYLITRGLLNNPDTQFLFSALPMSAGAKGAPAFTPPPANTPDGRSGDVVVQAGAQITAPTTADHVGGRVVLVGPNVRNSGTIATPDGQTILASGLQVGFDAHSSSDASLRGLDVYIGAVSDAAHGEYAGATVNEGLIEAYRGSITLAGKNVSHLGAIESSTTVSLNGRIDLLANYNAIGNTQYDAATPTNGLPFLHRASGSVTVGAKSVMRILPEWSSTEKAVGTALPLQSQVNVQGLAVHFGENAALLAPNAKVAISAGVWDLVAQGTGFNSKFIRSAGQIYLDKGVRIDVAGSTDVAVALAQYLIEVQLRGAELANSPVQRAGVLRGPTLTVDLRQKGAYNGSTWYGTPLADLSGYVNIIQRSAGELTARGGSVSLSAGESVVMQKGAVIDVSGGYLRHEAGFVQTTRLLQGGRLVDINDATPDQIYDGIYTGKFATTSTRWGVTKTYAVPWMSGGHYQQSYVEGANGGSIDISAPAMALDGEMRGHTVTGPRQRSSKPEASSLSLKLDAQQLIAEKDYPLHAPTPP